MPQKDDFLTRLQAQLFETLEQVRALEAAGHLDEALVALHEAQRSIVGLDHALLHRLPSADLLRLLGPSGFPDVERCLQCAELLAAEFEVRAAQGDADPAQAHKALDLYLNALAAEPGFAPHLHARLTALSQALAYAVPSAAQRGLAEVYVRAGRFDEAENWLYRWAETEPEAARARAEVFYRELLGLDDAALEDGGLPRAEVEEGLASVRGTPA
jgi:tetratricopeptide (TPR) repeat protein